MEDFTGEKVFVREGLARRLAEANDFLKTRNPKYCLRIVYGYRHPVVQEKYFSEMRQVVAKEHPELDENEIVSLTHNFIAVPEVAGHPTGGACLLYTSLGIHLKIKKKKVSEHEKVNLIFYVDVCGYFLCRGN